MSESKKQANGERQLKDACYLSIVVHTWRLDFAFSMSIRYAPHFSLSLSLFFSLRGSGCDLHKEYHTLHQYTYTYVDVRSIFLAVCMFSRCFVPRSLSLLLFCYCSEIVDVFVFFSFFPPFNFNLFNVFWFFIWCRGTTCFSPLSFPSTLSRSFFFLFSFLLFAFPFLRSLSLSLCITQLHVLLTKNK